MSAQSFYNVLDYGAKGDGSSDDSPAINAAIKAAATDPGGGITYIPLGLFEIKSSIVISSPSHLIIDGTIVVSQSAPGITAIELNSSNVTIEGAGQLLGVLEAGATNCGIKSAVGANNIDISGIRISNFALWPINIVAGSNVILDGLYMSNCGQSCEFANLSTNCWARNLSIFACGDSGFAFYGGVRNSGISDCNIGNSAIYGIVVLSDSAQPNLCSDIVIANNICHDSGVGGIALLVHSDSSEVHQGHQNISVVGNETYNNGPNGGGVEVSGAITVLISSNNIHDELSYGILVNGIVTSNVATSWWWLSAQVAIIGNHIFNVGSSITPGVGIQLTNMYRTWTYNGASYQATAHDITIMSNRIAGLVTGSNTEYAVASTPQSGNPCNNLSIQGNNFAHFTGAVAVQVEFGLNGFVCYNNA